MQIENQFEIPAPVPVVWQHLVDIPKVAPCFPRCRMTEVVDERTWNGSVTVFLGPLSYTFPGTLRMLGRDDEGRRVLLEGSGTEERGHGAAKMRISSWLQQRNGGTVVHISIDLDLEGRVAQYSRAMIEDVAARLVQLFADNFRSNLLAEQCAAPGTEREWTAEKQVGGMRLALWAIARALARLFGFGGRRQALRQS